MSALMGNIGETAFIYHATKYGLDVMMPFGVQAYDCVIYNNTNFYKIQIKSTKTISRNETCYKFNSYTSKKYRKFYTNDDVDFIVFFIFDLDLFYIIPVGEIKSKTIRLYPNKKHELNKFKEAWSLLL